jgi:hypothetical protein
MTEFINVIVIDMKQIQWNAWRYKDTKTSKDHTECKPSSEKLNKAKIKVRDALT